MTEILNNKSDLILKGDRAVWTMKMEGNVLGTYIGTFVFRCFLTPLQRVAAGREQRELLGKYGENAPELESFLAFALTQLKHRIVEAPPFWSKSLTEDGYEGNLPDENVISTVLDAAVEAELQYKEHLKTKREVALKKAKEVAEKIKIDQESQLVKENKSEIQNKKNTDKP